MHRPLIERKGDVLTGFFSNDNYEVNIPGDIREIGPRIFDWENLPKYAYDSIDSENPMFVEKVRIPASVQVIAPGAFALQTGVGEIEVDPVCPAAIAKNGTLYSRDMKRLITHFDRTVTDVVIPEGVEIIDDYAFFGAPLTSIEIPETVTDIGAYAFAGSLGLDYIEIPDSVDKLGERPFSFSSIRWVETSDIGVVLDEPEGTLTEDGKTLLIAFESDDTGMYLVPEGVTEIDPGAFYHHDELVEITIPEGVRELKAGTFFGLMQLETINLPKSLVHIERDAFTNCPSLKRINIPDGIVAIDKYAFNGCTSLEKLVLPGNIPDLEDDAFYGCDVLTIVAPEGSDTIRYARKQNIPYEEVPSVRNRTRSTNMAILTKGPTKMDEFLYVRRNLQKILGRFFSNSQK